MDKYIFENESLEELIKTGKHCIHKDYYNYLHGINITEQTIKENNLIKCYKIGIIIPNYNYSKWLHKCLGSILNQNYNNYEVILIDDMSTDNSVDIAKEYIDKMNIKIIELKQKRLSGGARNEGYLYLSDDVDYVWYMDSDDWLRDSNVLKVVNDNLQSFPDVLFVGLSADINGIPSCYYMPDYKDKYSAIKGWSGSSGKVIKKELATRQECLYKEGTLKEDRTQHYKICIYMNSFKCLKDNVYIWNRNNKKSVTTTRTKNWKVDTIRNYADALELYNTEKGKDSMIDQILMNRVIECENELKADGDSQR